MPREQFPYPEDREILDAFLMASQARSVRSYLEATEDGRLTMGQQVIAYYDTAGALVLHMAVSTDTNVHYIERAGNYLLAQLGIDERIVREAAFDGQGAGAARWGWRWAWGNHYVKPNEPLVLCGALGLRAYRATRANKTSSSQQE
jgi:hypothetical protein